MGEFKGTRGKWEQRQLFHDAILVDDGVNKWYSNGIDIHDTNGRIISAVHYMTDTPNKGWGNNETIEKWKANALLISKSPEMLEMLKECLYEFIEYRKEFGQGSRLESDIEQLIKEATEA